MGDIRARSNIKWATAMMLPEHVKLLRDYRRDINKVSKPILDEQEWEEIGRRLFEVQEYNEEITLQYYKDGYILDVTGSVIAINNSAVKIGDKFVDTVDIVGIK